MRHFILITTVLTATGVGMCATQVTSTTRPSSRQHAVSDSTVRDAVRNKEARIRKRQLQRRLLIARRTISFMIRVEQRTNRFIRNVVDAALADPKRWSAKNQRHILALDPDKAYSWSARQPLGRQSVRLEAGGINLHGTTALLRTSLSLHGDTIKRTLTAHPIAKKVKVERVVTVRARSFTSFETAARTALIDACFRYGIIRSQGPVFRSSALISIQDVTWNHALIRPKAFFGATVYRVALTLRIHAPPH